MAIKIVYRVLRKISDWASWGFYSEICVEGQENVPLKGPTILSSTHHNEIIDIAVLSTTVRQRRMISYWTKSSLFVNPISRAILLSAGSIPVNRRSKDNQGLFKGTFNSLASGEIVGIFPEGTSYTEPRIVQVKDGVAWAALEYLKWAKEQGVCAQGVVVVPVGIIYTDKSQYQSRVYVEYGEPITMDGYAREFLGAGEGESRIAAKRLCQDIEQRMTRLTINAPDWDTLYAARMARDLLWTDERNIPLRSFVKVSQTLVDIFADPHPSPALQDLKLNLLRYHSLLHYSHLTHASLSPLPLTRPPTIPRLTFTLLRLTLTGLLRIPAFAIPFAVHVPTYILSSIGARIAKGDEEARAQFKVVFGGLGMSVMCPLFGWTVWKILKTQEMFEDVAKGGGLGRDLAVTVGLAWLIAYWHNILVDVNFTLLKHFRASWKIFLGLLSPRSSDVPHEELVPYTTPPLPPISPFISKSSHIAAVTVSAAQPIASRRLTRHLLRARADAARSSAAFFAELDATDKFISAAQLALDPGKPGQRSGQEVVAFLRRNGAVF